MKPWRAMITWCLMVPLAGTGVVRAHASATRSVASPSARCTISILSQYRDALATYVLARATHDTVQAGGGLVDASGFRSGRPVFGQRVRVDSLNGPDAEATRRALSARRSNEVVIVPWHYGAGCGPAEWSGSARWTTPDSIGLYVVRLRPKSLWVGGFPTFDALLASIHSYAYGSHTVGPQTQVGDPRHRGARERSLTAAEVFALYTVLPTLAQANNAAALARLRGWVSANPWVRTRFPGTYILQGWPLDRSEEALATTRP